MSEFPVDTSYTIFSAYQKLINNYPFIKIVKTAIPYNIETQQDIVYKVIGGRSLHFDIFHQKEKRTKLYPAVILIHGGGWRSGNKKMMYPLAVKLAENNFTAVTVEYRLSPEAEYPAAVYDLKDAVEYLKTNSGDFRIDTNKIAILGCSAGGTLAALLGVTIDNDKFTNVLDTVKSSDKFSAVIDLDGILDFTDPSESGKDSITSKPSAGKLWLGKSFKENPVIWMEASPVNYVDSNSLPILFINSTDKRFHAGRDEFIEKLNKHNIYYEVHEIENSPHTFWLFYPWFDETLSYIINFLSKVLKG